MSEEKKEWTTPGTLILDAGGEYWLRGSDRWLGHGGAVESSVASIENLYGKVKLMFDPN